MSTPAPSAVKVENPNPLNLTEAIPIEKFEDVGEEGSVKSDFLDNIEAKTVPVVIKEEVL